MFIRAALLLPLVFSIDAFKVEDHHKDLGIRSIENPETMKTHQVLKNVGKRFFPLNSKSKAMYPDWSDLELAELTKTWESTPDGVVNLKINNAAHMVVQSLVLSTSRENLAGNGFGAAMNDLRTVLDEDFVAEICEDGKKLNPYQYMKLVAHSATQYKPNANNINYELVESNRTSIHVKTKFVTLDTNDLKVQIEFEFRMKLTFSSEWYYSLIYLKQGGSCVNQGIANMDLGEGVKDIVAEELEGLKTAPTAKLFFELFTPTRFKEIQDNPNYLPYKWMSGLNSSVVQISICQEGVTDMVPYSIYEFMVWYEKFGIMWHQKSVSDSNYIVQILELTSESISARVTMRLQMGTDQNEPEEDWNFKFTGKKMDGVWVLETISVMCIPTIKYREQSLKNIRDVIAATFIPELGYLNETKWSFAPELVRMFTKDGKVLEVTECRKGEQTKISQADLFKKDKSSKHGIKFTKYSSVSGELESPPPNFLLLHFDTMGIPADSSSEEEHFYRLGFEVEWDQRDQFYYIVRMGLECSAPFTVDRIFESIKFLPRRTRPPSQRLGK